MTQTTARLHAGFLARKGEARPASHASMDIGETELPVSPAAPRIDFEMRRAPVAEMADHQPESARVIELPRRPIKAAAERFLQKRHQIHARVSPDVHIRLKMASTQLDRTQQDRVASAIDACLSFIDDDVRPLTCGRPHAMD